MPRIATLYPQHQPSSGTSKYGRRRIDHNSYLYPVPKQQSRIPYKFSSRPRTLAHKQHSTSQRSLFSRHAHNSYRSSGSFRKSKLSFRTRTRSAQVSPQPLTLEEKLRIAADRVRRFEKQAKPQTKSSIKLQTTTRTQGHSRPHTKVPSKTKVSIRKRDKLRARLRVFTFGKS